jgi:hypothetical protein
VSELVFAAPALPLHTAGPYVAAAYIVFVVVVLVYVGIMAFRLQRTERELVALRRDLVAEREAASAGSSPSSPSSPSSLSSAPSLSSPEEREQEPVA